MGFNLMLLLRELVGNFLAVLFWDFCWLPLHRSLRINKKIASPLKRIVKTRLVSFYVAAVTLSVLWAGCKPIAHDPASNPPKTSKGGSAETLHTDPAARKNGRDISSCPSYASNAVEHQGGSSPDRSPVVTKTNEMLPDEIPCSPFTPKSAPDTVTQTGVISPDRSPVVTKTDEMLPDEIPWSPFNPKGAPDTAAQKGVISPDWSPVVTETDEILIDEIPCSPFKPKNTPDAVAQTGVISPDELRSVTRNLQRSMEKMSEPDPDESFDRHALNRPNSTEDWATAEKHLDILGEELQQAIDEAIQGIESINNNPKQ
jgi:hypothetical protein